MKTIRSEADSYVEHLLEELITDAHEQGVQERVRRAKIDEVRAAAERNRVELLRADRRREGARRVAEEQRRWQERAARRQATIRAMDECTLTDLVSPYAESASLDSEALTLQYHAAVQARDAALAQAVEAEAPRYVPVPAHGTGPSGTGTRNLWVGLFCVAFMCFAMAIVAGAVTLALSEPPPPAREYARLGWEPDALLAPDVESGFVSTPAASPVETARTRPGRKRTRVRGTKSRVRGGGKPTFDFSRDPSDPFSSTRN